MNNVIEENNPFLSSTIRIKFNGYIFEKNKEISIFLINSTQERKIELGRNYPFLPMKKGECIIHETLKSYIQNNEIKINIDLNELLYNHLLSNYYENKSEYNINITKLSLINSTFTTKCKVAEIINNYYGKLRDESKNIIFMELDYFFEYISKFIPEEILDLFPNYYEKLNNLNPNHYATLLIVNFPKNRIKYYIESDYNKLLNKGVLYANNLMININNLNKMLIDMPLIRGMQRYNYGSVLLNLILDIIIFSLFVLSLILFILFY